MERFTPLYEWIMETPELERAEGLLICRVLMWGEHGCFESSARLAKKLKMNPRSVQRIIKRLVYKDWLAVLYTSSHNRTIYVNPSKMLPGPLFEKLGYDNVIKKIALHKMTQKNFYNLGFIYLISIEGQELYKIGSTEKNPNIRMRQIQNSIPFKLSMVVYAKTDNCSENEHKIHRLFSKFRVQGEWYKLSSEDVNKIVSFLEGIRHKVTSL